MVTIQLPQDMGVTNGVGKVVELPVSSQTVADDNAVIFGKESNRPHSLFAALFMDSQIREKFVKPVKGAFDAKSGLLTGLAMSVRTIA